MIQSNSSDYYNHDSNRDINYRDMNNRDINKYYNRDINNRDSLIIVTK